jgi:hypothetical protein
LTASSSGESANFWFLSCGAQSAACPNRSLIKKIRFSTDSLWSKGWQEAEEIAADAIARRAATLPFGINSPLSPRNRVTMRSSSGLLLAP